MEERKSWNDLNRDPGTGVPERKHNESGVVIQKGVERFELTATTRVTPMPKLCTAAGGVLRCLSTARGESIVTDVDPASACILQRTTRLPLIHRLWSNSAGYSVGYTQRHEMGNPSELLFLHPERRVLRRRDLPDAATEILDAGAMWVVGCRNRCVYGFSEEGEKLWKWRMPPNRWGEDWVLHQTRGPDRLSVAVGAGHIAAAYGEQLWLLSRAGDTIWEYSLPQPPNTHVSTGEIVTLAESRARLIEAFGPKARFSRIARLRSSLAVLGENSPAVPLDFQRHPALSEDDESGNWFQTCDRHPNRRSRCTKRRRR